MALELVQIPEQVPDRVLYFHYLQLWFAKPAGIATGPPISSIDIQKNVNRLII